MSGVDAEWSSVHADFLRFQSDAPALYDFLMSYGLTWPSLSAQWLPVEPVRSAGSVTHQMLFGTYTPPSFPNFIHLAHVTIPDRNSFDPTQEFFKHPLAEPLRTAPDRPASTAASSSRRAASAASASSAAASSGAAAAPASSSSPPPATDDEYSASLPFYSRGSLKIVHKVRASQELHRIRPFAPSFSSDIGASSTWQSARDHDGARNHGPGQHSKALAAAKGPESEVKIYDIGRGAHQAQVAAAAASANGHVSSAGGDEGAGGGGGGGGPGRKKNSALHAHSGAKERDSALLTLTGHETGGWALDWNAVPGAAQAGLLVSADDKGSICLWSLEDAQTGLFGNNSLAAANVHSNGATHPPPPAAPVALVGTPAQRLQKGSGAAAGSSHGGGGGGSSASNHHQVPALGARSSWSNVHIGSINDIAWLKIGCPHTFLTVGDDCSMKRWDCRQAASSSAAAAAASPVCSTLVHQSHVSSVSTSPFDEQQVLTAGEDGLVRLWDMRNMKESAATDDGNNSGSDQCFHTPLHTFVGHGGQVLQVSWAPFAHRGRGSIFASSSLDRRIFIWDASLVDTPLPAWDLAQSGPPELMFVHAGHTDNVEDFSWHPTQPWLVGSVGAENVLQVWEMFDALHSEKEGPLQSVEEEESMRQLVQLLQPSADGPRVPLDLEALMNLGSAVPSHPVCAEMRSALSTPRVAASCQFVADYSTLVQRRLDSEGLASAELDQQSSESDADADADAHADGVAMDADEGEDEARRASEAESRDNSSSSSSSSRSASPLPPAASASARRGSSSEAVHVPIKVAARKRKRDEAAASEAAKGNGSSSDNGPNRRNRSAAAPPSSSAAADSSFSSLPPIWQARLREFKRKLDSVGDQRGSTARARFKVVVAKLASYIPDEEGRVAPGRRRDSSSDSSSDSEDSDSSDSDEDDGELLLPPPSSKGGVAARSKAGSAASSPRKRVAEPSSASAAAAAKPRGAAAYSAAAAPKQSPSKAPPAASASHLSQQPAPAPFSRRSLPPEPLPPVPRKYTFSRVDADTTSLFLTCHVPRALALLSAERTADKKAKKNHATPTKAANGAAAARQASAATVTTVKTEPVDAAAAAESGAQTAPPQPASNSATASPPADAPVIKLEHADAASPMQEDRMLSDAGIN